ncbi:membrane-anchored protein [Phyllobacterium sp. K27]
MRFPRFEIVTKIRRSIIYRFGRYQPSAHPFRFDGPVVVVGSAPVSNVPEGFDNRFFVISVNGSQVVAGTWGNQKPDATFMQFNQIEGQTTNALHVREVLRGKQTSLLYVVRWSKSLRSLQKGLAAFRYSYDELRVLNRYNRMALYETVTGNLNLEIDDDMKFSNGITAVLYAITNGAGAVIVTGINPSSSGHVYNDANLKRLHANTDKQILESLIDRGYQLFTADADVAKECRIPLWTAETLKRFEETNKRIE